MYLLGIVRAVRYPTATAPGLFYINTPVPMSTLSSVNVLVRASPSLSLPATFHLSDTRTAGGGGGAIGNGEDGEEVNEAASDDYNIVNFEDIESSFDSFDGE
jgi:hypothetical protein